MEEKIKKLEKENSKFKNLFYLSLVIVFPIAILGLIKVLKWEDVKLFILMIPATVIVFAIFYLLGLIVKKFKE